MTTNDGVIPRARRLFRRSVSSGAFGSIIIKLTSTALGLILIVLLARTLGPEEYGVYAYVFALASILGLPAQSGIPQLLIRETTRAVVAECWDRLRGLWRWSNFVVICLSFALICLGFGFGRVFEDRFDHEQVSAFYLGLLLVPLMSLASVHGACMRGLHHVVTGQLSEHIIRVGLMIVLVMAITIFLAPEGLTAPQAIAMHVVAAFVATSVGVIMLTVIRPAALVKEPRVRYETGEWVSAMLPLAFVSGMQLINHHADILMLGIFRSAADVGVYRVVVSGALIAIFGLQAINMIVAPKFARLYAENDLKTLQQMVTMSSRATLLLSVPVVLTFVLFGEQILTIVFGPEYSRGYRPLAILATGQFFNALAGPVGILLNMTGHERDTAKGVAVAAIGNVLLNLVLIPYMGMDGAAIATAITLCIWNFLLWRSVRNRLGIESIAFRSLKAD